MKAPYIVRLDRDRISIPVTFQDTAPTDSRKLDRQMQMLRLTTVNLTSLTTMMGSRTAARWPLTHSLSWALFLRWEQMEITWERLQFRRRLRRFPFLLSRVTHRMHRHKPCSTGNTTVIRQRRHVF